MHSVCMLKPSNQKHIWLVVCGGCFFTLLSKPQKLLRPVCRAQAHASRTSLTSQHPLSRMHRS